MFSFFKSNPRAALQKRYEKLLEEARDLQRAGKIPEFALKTAEAERVREQLDAADASDAAGGAS